MHFSQSVVLSACIGVFCIAVVNAQLTGKSKAEPAGAKRASGKVIVVVNKEELTDANLERMLAMHHVAAPFAPETKKAFAEKLIDTRLIRQFLATRKTAATKQEIDLHLEGLRDAAKRRGEDPDKALSAAGYPADLLRDEIGLRLAWKKHAERTVTTERLKSFFAEHRPEFDGTQVRASQIVRKVEATGVETEWQAAEQMLLRLRETIDSGKVGFDEAARKHSQAPTKDKGGDVGYFPFAGRMPDEFSRVAFSLKVGEMSRPFRTKFGVHLCLVTDRRPGDLSLEDVRDEVFTRISQEIWDQTVADLRKSAKIEWKVEQP